MKILTIKEFIKERQSLDDMSVEMMDEKLNQALASLLKFLNSQQIIFNKEEEGCFCTKLNTKFLIPPDFHWTVLSVYKELTLQLHEKNLTHIIVKGLTLSPVIKDDDDNIVRGIFAYIKYVKE